MKTKKILSILFISMIVLNLTINLNDSKNNISLDNLMNIANAQTEGDYGWISDNYYEQGSCYYCSYGAEQICACTRYTRICIWIENGPYPSCDDYTDTTINHGSCEDTGFPC